MVAAALLATAALPLVAIDATARVVCRVYTEGNQRVTEFCSEGYLCDLEARKCRPGPEARREMEAEKSRRMAEEKRRNKELRERLRKALKETRRIHSAQPAGPSPFNCSYKPAGGGAAWDAMCLDTVMSDPQRLAALRCNPGEACPRGAGAAAGGATTATRQATYTSGTYTPGTWYTPSDDWRRIPSPQYHRAQPPAVQRQAAARPDRPNQSLRETLRQRMRYGEAEKQINKLIAERDRHARNSTAWNAMNDVLKDLDRTLGANGLDLSASFEASGVYSNAGPDGGTRAGGDGAAGNSASESSSPPATGQPSLPPSPELQLAEPRAERPQRASRDEVYCSFVMYRVHSNDLAYRRIDQIPEQCRTPDMLAALAEQQRQNPTIIFDSSDREAIRQLTSSLDDLRDQAPPE